MGPRWSQVLSDGPRHIFETHWHWTAGASYPAALPASAALPAFALRGGAWHPPLAARVLNLDAIAGVMGRSAQARMQAISAKPDAASPGGRNFAKAGFLTTLGQ